MNKRASAIVAVYMFLMLSRQLQQVIAMSEFCQCCQHCYTTCKQHLQPWGCFLFCIEVLCRPLRPVLLAAALKTATHLVRFDLFGSIYGQIMGRVPFRSEFCLHWMLMAMANGTSRAASWLVPALTASCFLCARGSFLPRSENIAHPGRPFPPQAASYKERPPARRGAPLQSTPNPKPSMPRLKITKWNSLRGPTRTLTSRPRR
jgi:hypothetical protein